MALLTTGVGVGGGGGEWGWGERNLTDGISEVPKVVGISPGPWWFWRRT
jgi:hypothetical protein